MRRYETQSSVKSKAKVVQVVKRMKLSTLAAKKAKQQWWSKAA